MAKKKYKIKQVWSDNMNKWAYYIEYKGFIGTKKRVKGETWCGGEVDGTLTPVFSRYDYTKYFSTKDKAQDYVSKHFSDNDKTVMIIEID